MPARGPGGASVAAGGVEGAGEKRSSMMRRPRWAYLEGGPTMVTAILSEATRLAMWVTSGTPRNGSKALSWPILELRPPARM